MVRAESEILSYWQNGVYIRNGHVDVSVCQWKDKLVLQVKNIFLMFINRFYQLFGHFKDAYISVSEPKEHIIFSQITFSFFFQVLARSLMTNGSRQAVNKAWSVLTKYLYNIELVLNQYPGLYYEVC